MLVLCNGAKAKGFLIIIVNLVSYIPDYFSRTSCHGLFLNNSIRILIKASLDFMSCPETQNRIKCLLKKMNK